MSFSGDHPVVETILLDVSGSAIALDHSASLGPILSAQPGVMVAGYHSSSTGGFQASLFQLDDAGRLLVNPGASATTTTVTGTVALDRGDSPANPLYVSSSFSFSSSPGAPLYVTGTVIANVTGTVALDRGTSAGNPLFTTGSVGVTGIVRTQEVIATVATGTYFLSSPTALTILAANPNRRGALIYNLSSKAMYVKFGTAAAALDFTVKIFSDDVYNVPVLYTGIVTACWASGSTLGAMVTETTP